ADALRCPAGGWKAVLESPGGDLPFGLRIEEASGGRILALVVNGEEALPFDSVRMEGDRIVLRFDHYDSEIDATLSAGGSEMRGVWVKQAGKDRPTMRFPAVEGAGPRLGGTPRPGATPREGAGGR